MDTTSISIAETVVHGLVFDPKNSERIERMDLNQLFASVGRLFDLLDEREVDYVLVGGIAMLAYVEGRNTQDIDLIVSRKDLERVQELRIEDSNADFVRATFGDLQVDLLFTDHALFGNVSKNQCVMQKFAERTVSCATEEGLLLLKLYALPALYRQGQLDKARIYESDIAALLARRDESMQPIFTQLEPLLLDSDSIELRAIVADIEQRLERAKSRFK